VNLEVPKECSECIWIEQQENPKVPRESRGDKKISRYQENAARVSGLSSEKMLRRRVNPEARESSMYIRVEKRENPEAPRESRGAETIQQCRENPEAKSILRAHPGRAARESRGAERIQRHGENPEVTREFRGTERMQRAYPA
jgi:hypothetical protein